MAPLQVMGTKIEEIPQDISVLQQFYNGKSVFLTGGTGFLGKVIIEKLLRSTDVEHIYMLVRNKKGKDIYTRIQEIFDDPVFDKIKNEKPKFRHRVSVINGDCSQPSLGIDPAEQHLLKQNVEIVIHGAATVRFDEKLKMAIAINVTATRDLLQLCKEMTKLKAVVHVSSAFANCHYRHLEEKFYPTKVNGEIICKIGEYLDETTLDNITKELLYEFPNTYTYTKALAEDVVRTMGKNLPIAVFRPGIVITTYKEPLEGWIDNMYGPCGIVVAVAAGVLRIYCGYVHTKSQVVPVDLAVNALLASAWDVATNQYNEIPIYQFIPDPDNNVTWQTFVDCGYRYGVNIPISRSIWHPTLNVTPYRFIFKILSFLYHTIPAFFIDTGLFLVGKKPRLMQIYKKVHKFCDVMAYFSTNSWTFTNNNTTNLWNKLTEQDKDLFFFDMKQLDWQQFFEKCFYGLRIYVIKEDPSTIPKAKIRYERMKIIHYVVLYSIYALGLYLLYLFVTAFLI